ncbi:hypothetical protein [Actinomyces ruminis]|uniref:Helicase conserved C-terminal domain-containing protein n=1 Tax=Actinomyces ruminis TaxID=1937003 RepID=A0ABX4MDI5_9ACTO|nr:hypothetical protein [Actinomyces ruminis]PHP53511.1 hypothetical protein BW737_002200 [Actinomyces ruminis]
MPAAALQQLVLERAGMADAEAGTGGVEALAEAIASLEGVWLPAGLWEAVVFPARVADYRPAMLDELIASGEVVWVCRARGAAGADTAASVGVPAPSVAAAGPRSTDSSRSGALLGEIAFFPSDSPLAPVAGAVVGAGEYDVEEHWALVRAGQLTADSFAPVRTALQPRPTAAPTRRVHSRRTRRYGGYRSGYYTDRARPAGSAGSPRSMPPAAQPLPSSDSLRPSAATGGGVPTNGSTAAAGHNPTPAALATASWRRLTPPQATAEEQAVADVESLLDRYGVVSRDVALAAGIPGGITPLLPVLRRMEDTGVVLRGAFVEGLGPSQFAARESVDRLRALAGRDVDTADGVPPVVLDLKDPVCLAGGVVPWPEPALPAELAARAADAAEPPRPAARQGARVVLSGGRPVLHAAERLRTLTCYTTEGAELERALAAVVAAETREALREGARPGKRVVETLNGVSTLDPVVGRLLETAGLVRDPRGMRLHIDPYRS